MDLTSLRRPWFAIDEASVRDALVRGLQGEVPAGHVLHCKQVLAVARRDDCDDVLYALRDGYAVVHLTYGGRQTDPIFPFTELYDDWDEFMKERMIPDAALFEDDAD